MSLFRGYTGRSLEVNGNIYPRQITAEGYTLQNPAYRPSIINYNFARASRN
ncbi:hypothetical protein Trichorick_00311 [Candidatus Trichorickettsia mobilis]|uniref:Uncharacterized protein n=1 Tax=Candidatus Trichorickettsia mobilis TaxID=1346319 RepID=A0ABZ0UQW4_9RICK|nr:hypothetical protein Trichorick_00311 [Candidatus Trichorickettsia mobilis]